MTDVVVSQVALSEDGVELVFMVLPDDVRNEGRLVASRSYMIHNDHPAYADEIAHLRELVTELAGDVHEDFAKAPIFLPPEEDEDDVGMGEGRDP